MISKNQKSEILDAYAAGDSYRKIAKAFKVSREKIKKILVEAGIEILKPEELPYYNMAKSLRFDISHKWLMQFEDFEKLKTLNDCIRPRCRKRNMFKTCEYMAYLQRFYDCPKFNKIYLAWLASGKEKLKKPSVDHIISYSKTRDNSIENLQFLTFFENYCKSNLTQEKWNYIKDNLSEYFV